MKKSRFLMGTVTALLVLVGPQFAHAAACKDVKFTITNNHFEGRKIEIRKIRFNNPHRNGKKQTEDVKNIICAWGDTCTTRGDNLNKAAKVDLYGIQVEFRYEEHDGGWSKPFETKPFMPKFRKCVDGKKYGPIVVKDSP